MWLKLIPRQLPQYDRVFDLEVGEVTLRIEPAGCSENSDLLTCPYLGPSKVSGGPPAMALGAPMQAA